MYGRLAKSKSLIAQLDATAHLIRRQEAGLLVKLSRRLDESGRQYTCLQCERLAQEGLQDGRRRVLTATTLVRCGEMLELPSPAEESPSVAAVVDVSWIMIHSA